MYHRLMLNQDFKTLKKKKKKKKERKERKKVRTDILFDKKRVEPLNLLLRESKLLIGPNQEVSMDFFETENLYEGKI